MADNHIDEMLGAAPEPKQEEPAEETQEPVGETPEPSEAPEEKPQRTELDNMKAAMHEERLRRKELASELEQMKAYAAEVTRRMQAGQQGEKPPQYEEDPLGYLKQQVEGVGQNLNAIRQQQAQAQQYQHVVSKVTAEEQEFAKVVPDYTDAVNYLRQKRATELQTLGYGPQQIQGIIAQDTLQLVQRSGAMQQSVAKTAYELARANGYVTKAQAKSASLEAGAKATTSLQGVKGTPQDASGVPSNIGEMDDAEFNKLFAKMMKA